jgi:hypothetical protein
MTTTALRDVLEARQVWIYFTAVLAAVAVRFLIPARRP